MASDGRLVIYSTFGRELYLWDTGRQMVELLAQLEFVAMLLRFSNEDDYIVCVGVESPEFMVFSVELREWVGRSDPTLKVYDVIFSHDDKSMIASDLVIGGISQWDLRPPSHLPRPPSEAAAPEKLREGTLSPVKVSASDLVILTRTQVSLKPSNAPVSPSRCCSY